MTLCATEKGQVYLTSNHHSDLTWKWGYDEYSQIRARQFLQISEWFEKYPDYHFHVEQAETLKVFFEQYPDQLAKFIDAYKEGRLTLTGGNSISDVNLCCGETLVRNLQRGRKYYRDIFDHNVTIANLNDAFGMCFQIPQILNLAGYRFIIPGRLANAPENIDKPEPFVWCGANGTEVIVLQHMYFYDHGSKKQSLPVSYSAADSSLKCLEDIRDSSRDENILALYNDEAGLFCDKIFTVMRNVNAVPGKYEVAFGSVSDYAATIDRSRLTSFRGEFNPTFTGCYTTRIKVKQGIRATENLLFAAEMLAAGRSITADLDDAWHELELASFHDAACGCHHDQPNKEIMAKLKLAQTAAKRVLRHAMPPGANVFNPGKNSGPHLVEIASRTDFALDDYPMQRSGNKLFCTPVLHGNGLTSFTKRAEKAATPVACGPEFSTHYYAVDFSSPYPKIIDKRLRKSPFSQENFGELCFRHDSGSMWVERFIHHVYGRETQHEEVVSITRGPVFYEVILSGRVLGSKPSIDGSKYDYWDAFKKLHFKKTWRFYHDLDYFTLNLSVEWRGNATKIFINFPTQIDVPHSRALYDVPFGTVERKPYFEVPKKYESTWQSLSPASYSTAKGDWPAMHWVDYSDKEMGVTMVNSGTPGHQLVGGDICVSLLRSGTSTADGSMKPQPGSFANGYHEFEFAFRSHGIQDSACCSSLGNVLNRKPLFQSKPGKRVDVSSEFISGLPDNIIISSMRTINDGICLRLYENSGRTVKFKIQSDINISNIAQSDLRECEWEAVGPVLEFKPFEIKTLRMSGNAKKDSR